MDHRRLRWVALLGAVGLALLGQYYFALRPNYLLDGVIFYGLACLLFVAAVRPPAPQRAAPPARTWRFASEALLRGWVALAGIALALAVLLEVGRPLATYWPVFWAWVGSIGLYGVAFAPGLAGRPQAGAPVDARRPAAPGDRRLHVPGRAWEWLAVGGLVAGALALRAWHIDTIPWTLSGDEGNFGLYARNVLSGQVRNMFSSGHLSMPTMYFFFQAAWLRLAGDNVVGLRLPWAVVGTLSVLGCYLLVRRLFDRNLALLAALLLATYHFHIHYSRLGLNNISDPFFVTWALYFMVRGYQTGRRWAWVAAGMVASAGLYFYTGGRLAPVVMVAVLAWMAVTERSFLRRHAGDLLAMLGGFLVVAGPMLVFAGQHPDDFNARINQTGILQSGWLAQEVATSGKSAASLLLDQVQRAFLAFNLYPDRSDFYRPGMPLLDFAASACFVLGLAVALSRLWRRPANGETPAVEAPGQAPGEGPSWRYALFVLWFVLAVLLGGALTESPPSSQRLVATTVPVVFFVAMAVYELGRLTQQLFAWPALGGQVLSAVLGLALAILSLRFYFGTYQQSRVYGSLNGEVATSVGYYLRDVAAPARSAAGARAPDTAQDGAFDGGQSAAHTSPLQLNSAVASPVEPAGVPAAAAPGAPAARPVIEYFFGAPRMYADFGSTPFIDHSVAAQDVLQPLTGPVDFVDPDCTPVFVFLPERLGELQWVQMQYPGGVIELVRRGGDPNGPLLFAAYRLTAK